jgi:hypothetical protein
MKKSEMKVSRAASILRKELPELLDCQYKIKESYSTGGAIIEVMVSSSNAQSVRKTLPLIYHGYQLVVIKKG